MSDDRKAKLVKIMRGDIPEHECFMYDFYSLGDKLISTVDENDKLRDKLQRADKKIKTLIHYNESYDEIMLRQSKSLSNMHKLCQDAQLGNANANTRTEQAYTEVTELREANAHLRDKSRQARYYKDLYETGAKIRRGLAATIIEKDKSICELVDRVNDECEKNEKNVESLNYLSKHAQDYAIQLLANDATIHGLKKELRELRDKYEPKLVRCEGYAACQEFECSHWSPHKTTVLCDKACSACKVWNCIPWRGD